MTTVISRVFPNAEAAHGAINRLKVRGVPARECDVFVGSASAEALERAMVNANATAKYMKALDAGKAVVVARTTYRPLGAAKLARETFAKYGGVETKGATEDYFAPNTTFNEPSNIMRDHPHMMTLTSELELRGPITGMFGLPMPKAHRSKRSAMSGNRYMSRMFWPMKLLSTKTRKSSVIRGGRQMSRAFWPAPLISKKPRRKSVISGGAHPASRIMGAKTLS